MVPTIVHLERLILDALALHKLGTRQMARQLVARPVENNERGHIGVESHLATLQVGRAIQHAGQTLQRTGIVAQLVLHRSVSILRDACQNRRVHGLLQLEPRQQTAQQTAGVNLDGHGLGALGEGDEGRLGKPAAHVAGNVVVLRGARERQDLAAAHGVAHDKDGQVGGLGDNRLGEGGHVGEDLRRGAGQATVARGLGGAAPAALVERVDGNAARAQGRKEGAVGIAVVAVAVEEDEVGGYGAFGLYKQGGGGSRKGLAARGLELVLGFSNRKTKSLPSTSLCTARHRQR